MSSVSSAVRFRCGRCSREYEARVYSFIDAASSPALTGQVTDGSLFVRECPSCGCRELVNLPVVYRDASCLVCLSDREIGVEGLEGMRGRLVSDVGSLVEKVKIFHAGLDDVAMELVKLVIRGELGRDVQLRFLRTEGADNELIFTYPSEGRMEMVAVGFNVYEDSCGIVSRSPELSAAHEGMVRVDRDWVENFIR